jgi:hypothetical protein
MLDTGYTLCRLTVSTGFQAISAPTATIKNYFEALASRTVLLTADNEDYVKLAIRFDTHKKAGDTGSYCCIHNRVRTSRRVELRAELVDIILETV